MRNAKFKQNGANMRIFPRYMIILTILLVIVSGLVASLSSCSDSSRSSGSTSNPEQATEQPASVQTEPAEAAPSQEHHADNDGSHSSNDGGNNVYSHDYKTADIGMDAVIAIVLERIPGASRSNIDEIEREYDDGRIEYEGELHYNGYEYEFEIDGATGNILKWEIDD